MSSSKAAKGDEIGKLEPEISIHLSGSMLHWGSVCLGLSERL